MPSSAPLSFTGARWIAESVDSDRVERIRAAGDLSQIGARVVAARWDGETVPSHAWETPSIEHLHDPWSMLHMGEAIDRLSRALEAGEKIRIITDYDVDGTTSSLILQATLRLMNRNADVSYHIPNRFDEGYGFSVRAAQQAAKDGVGLIVTADIGVRDHAAVDAAGALGVDVLICDHHLPAGASVPEGATVLCPPQEGDPYPNRSLAACGVSLKLAQALLTDHARRDDIISSMLKLAAIGTVADLVPITTRENRAIVHLGLEQLNQGRHHPGLQALLDVCRAKPGQIRASHLGFELGPRINAAGRVADARLVVDLLNNRDPGQARELAGELNRLNDKRRAIQGKVEEQALKRIPDPAPPFVLLADKEEAGWHRGVVGIVASRIKDEVNRPTAVVSIQGETAVGSVRSIGGVHAVRALDSCADLLVKYGGHPMAAGFTVPTKHLDELRERLGAWVGSQQEGDDDAVRVRRTDGEVSPDALSLELLDELNHLGPWGMGNPAPRLVVAGVVLTSIKTMSDGKHLKFRIPQGSGRSVEAVWWGQGALAQDLAGTAVDVLGTLGENHYRGRNLQLDVKDVRRAGG